jgi:hypothetical protein
MTTRFLVGLFFTCLQLKVKKWLLAARQRRSNTAGTKLLHQLVPGQLAMVDNTYYLMKHWKDNGGHSVGGKFILSCFFLLRWHHFLPIRWCMSHDLISVPVNMENVHWVLFVICPENQEIIVIDSMYDPRSQYHINFYHNCVQFIQDYQKTKSLPQDKWECHMKPITVKQQVNQDECGVCMSLAMYCLILGLDYRTITPHLFHNQAHLFMFYTVMGYHFNADEDDNNNSTDVDEERGMITIVEDMSPHVRYNYDCNRYERQQQLRNKKNQPPLERAQLKNLYFPNEQGVCEESKEEESEGDDAYTDNNIIDDLEKEHEAAMPNNNTESEGGG